MVKLRVNDDWIELPATDKLVFVIKPGAGTYFNRKAYQILEENYNIKYFAESGGEYDVYSKNWHNNFLVDTEGTHLGSIVNMLNEYITVTQQIPSAIIVGSRGGQVSIGKVWELLWRGPTIIINAGCLLTNTRIPRDVSPLFITMGKDYFPHVKNIADTEILYSRLSEGQSKTIVHLHNELHMPKFTDELLNIFTWCLDYLLNKCEGIPLVIPDMTVITN